MCGGGGGAGGVYVWLWWWRRGGGTATSKVCLRHLCLIIYVFLIVLQNIAVLPVGGSAQPL